jgi:two-component system, chemotaxis family, sensor kinase Cph1
MEIVFAAAPVAMAMVDTTGHFSRANPAFCLLAGYTECELQACSLDELIEREGRGSFCLPLEPRTWECRIRCKHGAAQDVKISAVCLNDSDVLRTFLIAAWDITEFKAANQRLLQANAALIRINSELENFSLMAAHDLQEPLRMISSYAEQLGHARNAMLDERTRHYLDYITDGAKRMQTLVRELLSYARIGNDSDDTTVTDANQALEAALSNLRSACEESGAKVVCAGLPQVRCDHRQLVQLLQNLIGNAIKYRGEQPPVIRVAAGDQGSHWHFSICDNGVGIASEHHRNIFNPFTRVCPQDRSGDGIGLALCQRIVQRRQGEIWVESSVGQGATFHFTLAK